MKSRYTCAILAYFGGWFGLDLFYRRCYLRAILNVLFFWTFIPLICSIVRGFRCLWMDSDEEFNDKMVNY